MLNVFLYLICKWNFHIALSAESRSGEPIYYHGPHELCITAGS